MARKRTSEKTLFRLSHSSIETLEKCPYQWMQRYIKFNYPPVDKAATEFGGLCHQVAEDYAGQGVDYMKWLVRQYLPNYTFPPAYDAKLPKALTRIKWFYDKYLANAVQKFHEKELYTDLNTYFDFSGSLDVLYKNTDNEWVIVDYKTSKKTGNYRMQLATYFYLMCYIQKKVPKKIKAQVVYLSTDCPTEQCVHEYTLEIDDHHMAENRILHAINTIAKNGADEANWVKHKTTLCGWCDYFISGDCEGYVKPERE